MRFVLACICVTVIAAATTGASADEGRRLLPTPGGELTYVALGDSSVAGVGATATAANYPSRIAAKLGAVYGGKVRLVNLGVAGAVAADVVATQVERAVALHPALVTLSIGPNDVTTGVAPAAYGRDVERILRTLRERTTAVVVVSLVPDLAVTPRFARSPLRDEVGRRAGELNGVLAAAARRADAEIVDLYERSRREAPGREQLFASDGYHPSDAGYARWADVMWEGIARRLPAAADGARLSSRIDPAPGTRP